MHVDFAIYQNFKMKIHHGEIIKSVFWFKNCMLSVRII